MKKKTLTVKNDNLRDMARELVSYLFTLDPSRSEELVSSLIFELASAVTEQRQKADWHKKQADGIAAAKARGVQFGRKPVPLPDNFDEYCRAWQDGKLSLREAAESCGMEKATFHRAVQRRKEEAAQTAL